MTADGTENLAIIRLITSLGFAGVKGWRTYRNLSVAELAAEAGVEPAVIDRIEDGSQPDDEALLDRLARILSVAR